MPVVPPESWKMHGSVGSIRILRERRGRAELRLALDELAASLAEDHAELQAGAFPAHPSTIGSNSKSLCRSG